MEITLEQFKCIVRNLRAVDGKFVASRPESEAQFYINLFEPTISLLIEAYYGLENATKIWDFILGNSKFETIEELYEFVSDKYSKLVQFDSALTVSQLKQLFPDEKMFKVFEEIINKTC